MLSSESIRQKEGCWALQAFKDIGFDICTIWYMKDFDDLQPRKNIILIKFQKLHSCVDNGTFSRKRREGHKARMLFQDSKVEIIVTWV